MLNQLGNAIAIGCDNSTFRRHRFENNVRQTLSQAAQDKQVDGTIKISRIIHKAGQTHMILEFQFINLALKLFSQMSFTGNNQTDRMAINDQSGDRIDQMMKTLLFRQPSDSSDENSLGIKAESSLVPQCRRCRRIIIQHDRIIDLVQSLVSNP